MRLLILTLTLLSGAAAPGHAQEGLWSDVQVPEAFHLDLGTGAVADTTTGSEAGQLTYEEGRLFAERKLHLLGEESGTSFTRGSGKPVVSPSAEVGNEYLFELDERWGYLRVLTAEEDSVSLEFALAPAGSTTLVREPGYVRVTSEGRSLVVSWDGAEDTEFQVMRSVVAAPENGFTLLGTVLGGSFVDESAARGMAVEYRVTRVGGQGLGSRARGAVVDQPGDWPIALESGMLINVLSGATDGQVAHIEIVNPGIKGVYVRPQPGTRLFAAVNRNQVHVPWVLRADTGNNYTTAAKSIPVGGSLPLVLEGGIHVRLRFVKGEGMNASLIRQVDWSGDRVLPLPPEFFDLTFVDPTLQVECDDLVEPGVDADEVSIAIEREIAFGRDDWELIYVAPAGERNFDLPPETLGELSALARYRLRHHMPDGRESPPSEAVRIVHGDLDRPDVVESLIDSAFEALLSEDFDQRMTARDLLEEIGEAAEPRLIAALSSDDAELVSAARDLLIDSRNNVGPILEAHALREGITSAAPEGWKSSDADERALAVLRVIGQQHGLLADVPVVGDWLRVLAIEDPDEAVSRLAGILLERPATAGSPPEGIPYVLLPPAVRPVAPETAWSDFFRQNRSRDEVLERLSQSLDPNDGATALVMYTVRQDLLSRREGGEMERAELALRLVEQFQGGGDKLLLRAAHRLVEDPGVRLRARADFADVRLAYVPSGSIPEDLGRQRLVLDEPGLDSLVSELSALRTAGVEYVDLVLPPGDYEPLEGDPEPYIDIWTSGLRLLGDGVVIGASVRVQQARDVVLEGLEIVHSKGMAVQLVESTAVIKDCTLRGMSQALHLSNSSVELDGCILTEPEDAARPNTWSARISGAGTMIARETWFAGGTVMFTRGDSSGYFERCLIDGAERYGIQGGAVLRDSLVRSAMDGLANPENSLLEGVVFAIGGPLQRGVSQVKLCPEHVLLIGSSDDIGGAQLLDSCPLRK
jgi:hypothetical protein